MAGARKHDANVTTWLRGIRGRTDPAEQPSTYFRSEKAPRANSSASVQRAKKIGLQNERLPPANCAIKARWPRGATFKRFRVDTGGDV